MKAEAGAAGRQASRLWDLPVRVIHWSIAVLIPALWWTAENHEMGWHMRLGIVLLALLVFRILWGFVGSSTARFASFVKGPRAVLGYLRGLDHDLVPSAGHNPAGGWSVLALLVLMTLQAGLGTIAGDPDDGTTGPLNARVSVTVAAAATEAHEVIFNLILALALLHIAAILYYRLVRRDDLITPMVTGSRRLPGAAQGMVAVPAWRITACALFAFLVAGWLWSGAPFSLPTQ